ncbi:hypothetical protein C2C86_25175 [Escherichia coli]|nr:hypothetical protein [Escherichia coli O166:H6]EFN6866830.1 hypothetical protein [Escherichia coli O4:H5]EFO3600928.1 hypothetical protein [Escherichia coli]EFO3684692.1 hypothetical protein [Escherichia coli]
MAGFLYTEKILVRLRDICSTFLGADKTTPAGIFADREGFDITVGKLIQLHGFVIALYHACDCP